MTSANPFCIPPGMNTTTSSSRLARLEGFLEQDPHNASLLAEAFDEALRSGRMVRAEEYLRQGLMQCPQDAAWQWREAQLCMARHDWPAARGLLKHLLTLPLGDGLKHAVRHDLAQVSLRTGEIEQGLELMASLSDQGSEIAPVTQVLWLRLLHHADRADEALALAQQWASAGSLCPEAAGVVSLAALDMGLMDVAHLTSLQALQAGGAQAEALVTQGTLALARGDADATKRHLAAALQRVPDDGRALSAWGFAEMLTGDLGAARSTFERALVGIPAHVGTWHGLGWAALLQGDLQGARQAFSQALEIDRNFGESHGGLAVVQARLGERSAAERSIEVALRLDRECKSARYAQAVLNGEGDDAQKMQELAKQVMQPAMAAGARGGEQP
jgi:tetratricopeptide (TPR) repeat protein